MEQSINGRANEALATKASLEGTPDLEGLSGEAAVYRKKRLFQIWTNLFLRELSTDIQVITAEINAYQRVAGEAIFEIGRRLKHVKENDLAHGEFGKWLGSVGINDRVAQMMMKVSIELGTKTSTYSEIGLNTLYQIATMPEEQREVKHTVPSTGEVKKVDEMTVRELREVKKALKEAQDKLAGSRYDGVFEKWYRSMGFTKTSVYNYIYYFAEVQRLNSKSAIETFEELPKGLAYEIAKPSAESTIAKSQAKSEVLDGKIDTLKEYKQRIQELESQAQLAEEKRKQAESLAETARKDAEIKERHYGDQSFRGVLFCF